MYTIHTPPPAAAAGQVGAEIGVGMCDSIVHGTNWRMVAKFFTSWVATVFITGILSAAFFSQGKVGRYEVWTLEPHK